MKIIIGFSPVLCVASFLSHSSYHDKQSFPYLDLWHIGQYQSLSKGTTRNLVELAEMAKPRFAGCTTLGE